MFVDFNLETLSPLLNNLSIDTNPLWGEMTPSQMVIHLTELLEISNGKNKLEIITPEDKLPLYVKFLESEKEMPRGFKVDFVVSREEDSKADLKMAIEKHNDELGEFLKKEKLDNFTENHPLYGELNFDQWRKLHSKHHTHHLKQFGLIPE